MFYIDKESAVPIYEQLYSTLVDAIKTAALEPGTNLPSTRSLAESLSISRNTVNKAYYQLAAEGYIQSRPGSGFTINNIPAVSYTHLDVYKRQGWLSGNGSFARSSFA